MKNTDFNGRSSSDLSVLVGSSSNLNSMDDDEEPKLENFLGSHSFSDHDQKLPLNCSSIPGDYMYPATASGVSMIKTWLRNQPTPPSQQVLESNNGDGVVTLVGDVGSLMNSQGLSLSMSTGPDQLSSHLPIIVAGPSGGGATSPSMEKRKGGELDGQSGAMEVVPRKSIDTFRQRTSIYRGVTSHRWTGR